MQNREFKPRSIYGRLVLRPGFEPGSPAFFHLSCNVERPEYLAGLYYRSVLKRNQIAYRSRIKLSVL